MQAVYILLTAMRREIIAALFSSAKLGGMKFNRKHK